MPRLRDAMVVLTAAALALAAAWAQELPDEDGQEPAAPQEALPESLDEGPDEGPDAVPGEPGGPADESTVDPELDDSDLDDQTYESDDDIFVPSEEIPADEPIPFPSDI